MMVPPPIQSQYGFMLGPVPSLGCPRKRGTLRLLLHILPEILGSSHTALGLPLSGRSLLKSLRMVPLSLGLLPVIKGLGA